MIATCGGRHRKPLNPNMTTAGIIPASPTSPGPILTATPDQLARLKELEAEVAELRMERDLLKRSVACVSRTSEVSAV